MADIYQRLRADPVINAVHTVWVIGRTVHITALCPEIEEAAT